MSSKEHPKLKQLREFIGGRTVCFQVNGPSITHLPEHLDVIPTDVVWMAHNFFRPTERIIEKIGRSLDLVYVSCLQTIAAQSEVYREFLERKDNNLLLTTTGATSTYTDKQPGLLEKFSEKVIVARCEVQAPREKRAFEVIQLLGPWFSFVFATLIVLKAGAPRVIFFGLDGGLLEGYTQWYYGDAKDYPSGWFRGQPTGYISEVDFVNREWGSAVEAARLDPRSFCIYNCSPKSNVTCFKRIAYEDLSGVFNLDRKVGKDDPKGFSGGSVLD